MLRKYKINTIFLAWFLIIALIPLVFFGYTSSRETIKALKKEVNNTLISVTDNKAHQIMNYFFEREKNISSLASSPSIIDAMRKYRTTSEKNKIVSPIYGGLAIYYESVEREYGNYFAYFNETAGYDDLILISPDGNVIFTVAKEDDLGTNLKTGPYKDTELAKVFERANTLLETNMSDYGYYQPSGGPAAFIAAPVLSKGILLGVVALQVDNDEIKAIVNDYTGLGETGETIVVSRENNYAVFVMPTRHDSHAAFKKRIFIGSEKLLPIQKAIKGQKGYGMSVDYMDKKVLAAWRYLPHLRWGMVVKIDIEEAFQPIASMRNWSIFIGVITTIIVILAALLVSGIISNPIIKLTRTTKQIADGDLTSKLNIKGSVEIVELEDSFNTMVEQLEMSRRELTEHRDHLKEMVDERTKELKETQERLISEERFAVLGKLSGSIAHEIRNPLATIDTTAYYLKRTLKDMDEKTMSRIDRIIDQVRESTDIIQSLQDLTKMKEPKKSLIDISNIIEEVICISNISPNVEIINGVTQDNFFIYLDGKQISIVFRNIFNNAVQAMDNKGTIRIIADKAEDEYIDISIIDSGPGIEPEKLKNVFQPFYGTKASGFGYGLTICEIIMEKHGGKIMVKSEEGEGAAFILRFRSSG